MKTHRTTGSWLFPGTATAIHGGEDFQLWTRVPFPGSAIRIPVHRCVPRGDHIQVAFLATGQLPDASDPATADLQWQPPLIQYQKNGQYGFHDGNLAFL